MGWIWKEKKFKVCCACFMGNAKTETYKRNEGEKKIQTDTKSDIIIIHTLSRKEENDEKHSMAWKNIFFHHCSHPHEPSKNNKVANTCVNNFLFFLRVKRQHHPEDQKAIANHHEMKNWPLQDALSIVLLRVIELLHHSKKKYKTNNAFEYN